ncbi:unnamed protein product [Brugia timori]|uniref:Uncharacterized protein n=1 Tax=Brugia timori TaxID=42155 RepID=A0A0R3RAY7_9BILA|nr:unnamed protein product [Brugia timori]
MVVVIFVSSCITVLFDSSLFCFVLFCFSSCFFLQNTKL